MSINRQCRQLLRICLLVAMVAPAAGRGAAPSAVADVEISDFSFRPGTATVFAGTTVRWTNRDSVEHTATADDASWDTGTLVTNASGSHTFKTPGRFAYHCRLHQFMTGVVVVKVARHIPLVSR